MLNVREGDPSPLSIKALSARSPPRPSPRHSTRLAPLSMIRAETARPSTTSAAVRGGGRLYMESPVDGYSEQEMIREAQLRIEHNKQRLRLKQLLSTAAEGGPTVKTQDLVLACQLAKMPVSPEKVLTTPFAANRDCRGSPKTVLWKSFHDSLEYPKLHGHGGLGELPPLRATRRANAKAQALQAEVHLEEAEAAPDQASDDEVYFHHQQLKRLMETRFSEIRRAFRLIDEDSSGTCDRRELKFMLNAMFNLSIPDHVLDRLIDLADFDGDGQIDFAEFARLMTAENVLNMKNTLVADTSAWGEKDPSADKKLAVDYTGLAALNRKMAAGGHEGGQAHVKLRRTGPGIHALRRAHHTFKKAIGARYTSVKQAFAAIDKDSSGYIRRGELRAFLRTLTKSIPDRVISGLLDFCDSDGDTKTLSFEEFCAMMEAENLGAGGYDPSVPK